MIFCLNREIAQETKPINYFSLVASSHHISLDKKQWFEKFASVFSSEAANEDITSDMKEEQ